MFESLSRGWSLTKTSFQVLKLDKEILALPVLSGVLLVLLTATFVVPLATIFPIADVNPVAAFAYLFAFYVLAYFLIIYFNAAVVECAMIRFNGGDPILRDGLRKSWEKKGLIFRWAIVAATVGLILKMLENAARNSESPGGRMVGQIAVWLVGAAWNTAVYFVVPVILYQGLGPLDAVRASWGTWRRAGWEGVTAAFGTGLFFGLLSLLGLIPLYIAMASGSATVLLAVGAVVVLYWLVIAVVGSAVNGIVTAATYKYAVDGRLPEAFAQAPLPQVQARYA